MVYSNFNKRQPWPNDDDTSDDDSAEAGEKPQKNNDANKIIRIICWKSSYHMAYIGKKRLNSIGLSLVEDQHYLWEVCQHGD